MKYGLFLAANQNTRRERANGFIFFLFLYTYTSKLVHLIGKIDIKIKPNRREM